MYRYYRFTDQMEKVHETAWGHTTDEGWTMKGEVGLTVSDSDDSMKALEDVTSSMLRTVRSSLWIQTWAGCNSLMGMAEECTG